MVTSQLLTCGTRPTVYFDSRLGLNWNNGESFLPDVYTFFETRLFSTLLRSTLTEEFMLMRKSGHKKNNGKVMNYAGGGLKEKRS